MEKIIEPGDSLTRVICFDNEYQEKKLNHRLPHRWSPCKVAAEIQDKKFPCRFHIAIRVIHRCKWSIDSNMVSHDRGSVYISCNRSQMEMKSTDVKTNSFVCAREWLWYGAIASIVRVCMYYTCETCYVCQPSVLTHFLATNDISIFFSSPCYFFRFSLSPCGRQICIRTWCISKRYVWLRREVKSTIDSRPADLPGSCSRGLNRESIPPLCLNDDSLHVNYILRL